MSIVTPLPPKDGSAHPWFKSGRRSFSQHYKTIGNALVTLERDFSGIKYLMNLSILDNLKEGSALSQLVGCFRVAVSFVPLEVLESFLEDLLDIGISEERLNIQAPGRVSVSSILSVFGLGLSFATGFHVVSTGGSLLFACALMFILVLPAVALWYFAPQFGVFRRFKFAKIVSMEISRRRGSGTEEPGLRTRLVFEKLLGKKISEFPQGAGFTSSPSSRTSFLH